MGIPSVQGNIPEQRVQVPPRTRILVRFPRNRHRLNTRRAAGHHGRSFGQVLIKTSGPTTVSLTTRHGYVHISFGGRDRDALSRCCRRPWVPSSASAALASAGPSRSPTGQNRPRLRPPGGKRSRSERRCRRGRRGIVTEHPGGEGDTPEAHFRGAATSAAAAGPARVEP